MKKKSKPLYGYPLTAKDFTDAGFSEKSANFLISDMAKRKKKRETAAARVNKARPDRRRK